MDEEGAVLNPVDLTQVVEVKEVYDESEMNELLGNGENWRCIDTTTAVVRKTTFEKTRYELSNPFFYRRGEVGHCVVNDKMVTKYVLGRVERKV